MKRTTLFADESLLRTLQELARKKHMSLAAIIRIALEQFVSRQQATGTLPSFFGIGQSGKKDISERAEEVLWTAPHRPPKP